MGGNFSLLSVVSFDVREHMETKHKEHILFTLFLSTLKLSTFTFGGGYVIVPLMRSLFVEKLQWIENEEMLDIIAIAQSAPGPIAVNTSVLVGYKMKGIIGALVTLFGTILPPMVILTIISLLYTLISENKVIEQLLLGMRVGVAAVILHAVFVMAKNIVGMKKVLPIIIMVVSFILSYVIEVNIILILMLSATVGVVHYVYQMKKERK
jgi:chromate transporter